MPISKANLTGNRCQCPTCGEVFSTENNFNKHRKGKYGKDRHCVSPEKVGLVLVMVKDGCLWKTASDDNLRRMIKRSRTKPR